jgi:hypothetical protein
MGTRRLTTSLVLVLVLTSVLPASVITWVHVSPDGSDANLGRTGDPSLAGMGPVATLERARDILREQRDSEEIKRLIKEPGDFKPRIVVADGRYVLTKPLVLSDIDSGTTIEAAPGAHPVFSGGRLIGEFEQAENGWWREQIPEVANGSWHFEQLFVNGRRATRARTPNKFYSYMGASAETPIEGKPGRFLRVTSVPAEAIAPLRGLSEAEVRDIVLVAYHKWCITRRYLTAVDFDKSQIITTGEKMATYAGWPAGTRFHLENFKAAIDEPGEWFLSRDGTLSYKPRPGEDMSKTEVIAPFAPKLVLVEGKPDEGKFVEGVTLKGLTFEHQNYVLPETGYPPFQAAFPTEAAVMLDGARNVTIQDCEVAHTGEYAVWFRQGCQNCRIERSYLHDLGSGGVRIGEGRVRENEASRTHHITVDNNIIRTAGRIYMDAVGVWIGHSGDNAVTHNEIADLYYTGISAGWVWGYSGSIAKRNNISFNRVHHLGWAVLSDMGGIYTLGASEGTVIANNIFHDIYAYSYGGWGLYTDEGSTGIVLEKNLVYNTKTGSFHQHYGKENIVRNNILVNSMLQQLQATRVEPHLSFTFEKNIVYWQTGALLAGPWTKVNINMDNNCYWNAAGQEVTFAGLTLEQWRQQQKHDEHSIIADPGFADVKNLDFHLKPDSPALKLGFEPFDYTQAGVYGDPAWRAKANDVQYPALEWPPDPPPVAIKDDFEKTAVGQLPQGAEIHVENKGDSIVVTDETAAGGSHSLKITDAPGLQNVWDPHLVYSPNHGAGTTRCAFDLQTGPGVSINHEWRDWRETPYRVGPSFSILGSTLQIAGKALLSLPAEKWIHFEVAADLGTTDSGTWSLTVTVPGEAPRTFQGLKNGSRTFEKLTWLGFTSNATSRTAFYLDNLEIANES